jgi:D-glycero-alpha-D-manno-heptose 1-phosphate guanylyltransferase
MIVARAPSCIVLAGGLGTRLRSEIGDIPKCLAPIGERTFLEYQIDYLHNEGIHDIVLSLGYGAATVIAALQARPRSRPVRWVVESTPRGTGGAIWHALNTFGLDDAIVTNGDTYLSGSIGPLMAPLRRDEDELLRLGVVRVADRARYGGVQIDGSGLVRGFVEKGVSGPGDISAGVYRLCREAFGEGRDAPFSIETDVLPDLVEQCRVRAARLEGHLIDIGIPEDYRRFLRQHG